MDMTSWLSFVSFLALMKLTLGLDRELSCAVCRALVDEVNYSISKVDPKKTIQVGSFRVDSRGNQGTYEKSYARSELHLIEIFEEVCKNFQDYAETTNDAGQRSVTRTRARDGKTLSLKNIKISSETNKALKHRCETLVEEYEDEMVAMFRREDMPDIEKIICGEMTSQCSEQDLSIPMPTSEALPDADDDINNKENTGEEEAENDPELVKQYLKDNADSIPADFVVEKKADGTEEIKEREEL